MGRGNPPGRGRSLPEQSRGRDQERGMEKSRYNCERKEGREKEKSPRSKLGKPVFTTDQHWLQGHQAEENLGV